MGIKRIIKNTILCIKHPWLYPRNFATGLHYYNYYILNKINKFAKRRNLWGRFALKVLLLFHNYILAFFHCIPKYTWLDDMPQGWRIRFGDELIQKVSQAHREHGGKLRILDIKEKYGSLRIYACCNERVQNILNIIEEQSCKVCINCGKDANYYTRGWVLPYCKNCLPPDRHFIPINELDEEQENN